MNQIKILGTGCAGCKALYNNVVLAVSELNIENVEIVKEEDIMKIMEYNVTSLPAIVIDGQVRAKGRLSLSEVKKLLSE